MTSTLNSRAPHSLDRRSRGPQGRCRRQCRCRHRPRRTGRTCYRTSDGEDCSRDPLSPPCGRCATSTTRHMAVWTLVGASAQLAHRSRIAGIDVKVLSGTADAARHIIVKKFSSHVSSPGGTSAGTGRRYDVARAGASYGYAHLALRP